MLLHTWSQRLKSSCGQFTHESIYTSVNKGENNAFVKYFNNLQKPCKIKGSMLLFQGGYNGVESR